LAVAGLWILVALTRAIADMFNWPLWGVYGVVGGACGVVGLILLLVVRNQLQKLRLLPRTRETLTGRWRDGPVAPIAHG
jgi:hypothetical protein